MEESVNKEKGLINLINVKMDLSDINAKTLSPQALAFIGDGVYELVIRTLVVDQGNAPVNDLHKKSSKLVEASAQAKLYRNIKDELTPEETRIFKRGRNTRTKTKAKSASRSNYRIATGLEALIGYLYLTNDFPRVLEIIRLGLNK